MTDTPRETIPADIRNRLAKATPTNHPLLKLFRYEHGGGRLFIDGESGARELIADFYSEGNREFYSQAFADVEWLLAECDTLRAQLAAREGEIATLTALAYFQGGGRTWKDVATVALYDHGEAIQRADTAEAQLRAQAQDRQRLADASIARPPITKESQP